MRHLSSSSKLPTSTELPQLFVFQHRARLGLGVGVKQQLDLQVNANNAGDALIAREKHYTEVYLGHLHLLDSFRTTFIHFGRPTDINRTASTCFLGVNALARL
jgi:hypothetical protein